MKYQCHFYRFFLASAFSCAAQSVLSATISLEFVDTSGKPVADSVVSVIPEIKKPYPEPLKATIDQRNKIFVPGVLAVRVNTLVYFPNGDDVRHQVYSFSPAKRFELRLYHGLTAEPVLFDQPGQVVLGCNIHDSMVAYIYVVDTEYFAISDMDGKLTIKNIPAGNYTLEIQHPKLIKPYPSRKITLTAEQTENQKITLAGFVEEKKSDQNDLNSLFK